MPKLLVKPKKGDGRVTHITPKSAKWKYVGFDLWKSPKGKTAKGAEAKRETCLVFVSGKGKVTIGGKDFGVIGDRMSPFEGKPWSIYVPPGLNGRWQPQRKWCLLCAQLQQRANMKPASYHLMGSLKKCAARAQTPAMSPIFFPNKTPWPKACWLSK